MAERGRAGPLRIMLWLTRHTGWLATWLVLPGVTLWYFACSRGARTASAEFLRRALGRPPGALGVLRHLHTFASAIVDRVLLLSGGSDAIRLDADGIGHIAAAAATGRGCVLLGAHLGSFEVLRCLRSQTPVTVKALMYRRNGGALTEMMERLDPASLKDVIPIGDTQSMIRVHEAVRQGAIVGILADRAPEGARFVQAPFFGQPARFPSGPFVLAASLGVPVLTFYAVRTGHRRYHVRFEPFADPVVLARATRQHDLAAIAARYAAWLERCSRAHPFNWFNFFHFWDQPAHGVSQADPRRAGSVGRSGLHHPHGCAGADGVAAG